MTMLATAPVLGGTAWMADAVCYGHTAVFFAPPGERPEAREVREARARSICHACPVDVDLPGLGPGQPGVRLLGRRVRRGARRRRVPRRDARGPYRQVPSGRGQAGAGPARPGHPSAPGRHRVTTSHLDICIADRSDRADALRRFLTSWDNCRRLGSAFSRKGSPPCLRRSLRKSSSIFGIPPHVGSPGSRSHPATGRPTCSSPPPASARRPGPGGRPRPASCAWSAPSSSPARTGPGRTGSTASGAASRRRTGPWPATGSTCRSGRVARYPRGKRSRFFSR